MSTQKERRVMMKRRENITQHLNRFKDVCGDPDDMPEESELRLRMEKCENLWSEFDNIQSILEDHDEDEKPHRLTFEKAFFEIIGKAKKYLAEQQQEDKANSPHARNESTSSNSQPHQVHVKLPTLNLVTFSGKYEDWVPFHDTFESLINANTSISDIQRFHYLKSCLKGEAEKTIQSISVSAGNYAIAWNLLKKRFENKKLLVMTHIKSIFDTPAVIKESASSLRQLHDDIVKNVTALQALGQATEKWDMILIYIVSSKLDELTKREWETLTIDDDLPTYKVLVEFLNSRCKILESISKSRPSIAPNSNKRNDRKNMTSAMIATGASCYMCKEQHLLYQCSKFLQLVPKRRLDEAQRIKLCLNCLRSNHSTSQCRSSTGCKICAKKHNTLLHIQKEKVSEGMEQCSHTIQFNHVLLSTAIVQVQDAKGRSHDARVLLDTGSQANFITEALVKRLGLELEETNAPISGISKTTTYVKHSTMATIKSKFNAFTANLLFKVLPKITTKLPLVNMDMTNFTIPTSIKLADPTFHKSGNIDMLLGAEIFWSLMCVGQIKMAKNQPFIQKTQLGWIISGKYNPSTTSNALVCNLATDPLDQQLAKFWSIEEDHIRKYNTKDDQICEEIFGKTTQRINGRYMVDLPFKSDPSSLGESRGTALKRFANMERKFQRDHNLQRQYIDFMDEYIKLGHMKLLPSNEENIWPHFYLPHHAVLKSESKTTKLRVVYDGSCKTSSGFSLNECLLVGPQLQEDLVNIVSRFRTHKYAITADVAKMYRQILMNPAHAHYQRIVWRKDSNEPIETYTLNTVTYGTAPASFLAIRALQQSAKDLEETYPMASAVIKRDFYVDDLISGSNSISEGHELVRTVSTVLKEGGFELRKWNSNDDQLLSTVLTESDSNILDLNKDSQDKILGLIWSSKDDQFKYSIVEQDSSKTTKRGILSRIARIFDPLGLISPIIITGKILLQKLWQIKSHWDESVPEHIYNEWQNYLKELHDLNNLVIPRRITQDDISKTYVHGFSDASETAYGACLYLWTVNTNNQVKTALICSKSRVAPLKNISLPRLELCGAQLMVQIMRKIIPSLNIEVDSYFYWTDSQIVLAWIRSESKTWITFVANRVGEIQEHTRINEWHHVSSEENPADVVSRGASPSNLIDCSLWWNGPSWLQQEEALWPTFNPNGMPDNDIWQERKITALFATTQISPANQLVLKYSSITKLQRVLSYCFRFATNCRNTPDNRNKGSLEPSELRAAMNYIIRTIQYEEFHEEIKQVRKASDVHSKSRLSALKPFLDDSGLLRVGGRLTNSNLEYTTKHPIILPGKHFVTRLIISHEHRTLLHAGARATLAALRQRFWPIAGLTAVKSVTRSCIPCFRVKPTNKQHIMGDLPDYRTNQPTRPFIHSGVDYCGPFTIREGARRTRKHVKIYVAVFVCLSTKATHLEVVMDLTSEAFLNAFKRFMCRRGMPQTMHSDNGTNFIGADRQLQEFVETKEFGKVVEAIHQKNIVWKFIPPRAPHMGGLWESTVKSFKKHFKNTVANASLNYEEFLTIVINIEGCLNSRPLTPMFTDPTDLNVLTPSHFLIGDSLMAPIEHDMQLIKENRLTRWERVQQINQHFWTRWSTEYLTLLQHRAKWKQQLDNGIVEGSMVVMKDDQQPPLRWLLGRVVQTHPGKDGVVRAATVLTSRGTFVRPCVKLCALPHDSVS